MINKTKSNFKISFIQKQVRLNILKNVAKQMHPQNRFQNKVDDQDAMFKMNQFTMYVHIPFCNSACKYCIFRKSLNKDLVGPYIEALLKEIDMYAKQARLKGMELSSLYIGGGTPSFIDPLKIKMITDKIRNNFNISKDFVITMEGNPESLKAKNIPVYKEAGITRISIGVQSLNDNLLKSMGRDHTSETVLNTIKSFQVSGFTNLSTDMIYGFKDQTEEIVLADIQKLIDLKVPHISIFPLIDAGTKNKKLKSGNKNDDKRYNMYIKIVNKLKGAGYYQYSADDFAKGNENENKYEKDSFQFPKMDTIAVGASALGSFNKYYYTNIPNIDDYITSIKSDVFPRARLTNETEANVIKENILLGLKYGEINKKDFYDAYGIKIEKIIGKILSPLKYLGIWKVGKEKIELTQEGFYLFSEVWAEIVIAATKDASLYKKPLPEILIEKQISNKLNTQLKIA